MLRSLFLVLISSILSFSQEHLQDCILYPSHKCLIQINDTCKIKWHSNYQNKIRILLSEDNGKFWNVIKEQLDPMDQECEWFTGTVKSKECLLRIESVNEGEYFLQSGIFTMGDIDDYYGKKWNGLLPRLQPFNTTDYYGSGDINLDSKVDQIDIHKAAEIASGTAPANIRADVDGDGSVTSSDLKLLSDALNGDFLPAWWNAKQNTESRISWLKKMLSLDQTDKHPYITGKYECSSFAAQLFRNFTGYNAFSTTEYSSQTIYNIPVYYVLIDPPSGTPHNLNCVLIGDDPCTFNDWLFIEPQNDEFVTLEKYPSGTKLSIMTLFSSSLITFLHGENQIWTLTYCSPNLVQGTPAVLPEIQNSFYTWYPVAISKEKILYECATDDMSRVFRIHIADLDSNSTISGQPLTAGSAGSHLILSRKRGGCHRCHLGGNAG